jgi:hypothetical protein
MSNYYENAPQGKDPHIWEIAKRRASFKYHLISYILVIGAMWLFWSFTTDTYDSYAWPVWPTLGWGIGLTFHFLGAYVFPCSNNVEKEYEKLIRNKR